MLSQHEIALLFDEELTDSLTIETCDLGGEPVVMMVDPHGQLYVLNNQTDHFEPFQSP